MCRQPDPEYLLKEIRDERDKLKAIDAAIVTIASSDMYFPDAEQAVLKMFGVVRVKSDELDRRESEVLNKIDSDGAAA
jgi:hypothetical protein